MSKGVRLRGAASAVTVAMLLAACSSGGSGGSSTRPLPNPTPTPSPTPTPTPTPTPPPTNYDTAEYRDSTYAVSAKSIAAYEEGATGNGVRIAVVDTGINPDLPAFDGRIHSSSGDVAGSRGVSDSDGHGTAVTSIAAAARDGEDTLGIAFEATILSYRADQPGSCAEEDGCSLLDRDIAEGIDRAVANGARVINLSLGGGEPSQVVLDALRRASNAGIVIVIAAGNDGPQSEGGNPNRFASVPAEQLPDHVIIAGAVGVRTSEGIDDSRMADFSNLAGDSRFSFLTALGTRVQAPDHTGQQFLWSGTSFATPVISGAVALLAQAFPNLTGAEIVEILFESADDLGDAGVDATFGWGRLNIESAFAPSGQTSLAGSKVAVSLAGNGQLPAAAGDAAGGAGQTTLITDKYDRAYRFSPIASMEARGGEMPLSTLDRRIRSGAVGAGPVAVRIVAAPTERLALTGSTNVSVDALRFSPEEEEQVRLLAGRVVAAIDENTAVAMGFSEGADSMRRELAHVADDFFLAARQSDLGFTARRGEAAAVRREVGGTGLTMGIESGDVALDLRPGEEAPDYRRFLVGLDRDFGGGLWGAATFSRLEEEDTILGGRFDALWGGGASASRFLDLDARQQFGAGWSVTGHARRGWTRFDGGKFVSSAYDLTLAKNHLFGTGDRLAFRVAQPLRVERGGLNLYVPTAWDYATETATLGWQRFSLTPSGRELVSEASYSTALLGGQLGTHVYWRRDPGHVAAAPDDHGVAVRFAKEF